MKITTKQLKQIILEELKEALDASQYGKAISRIRKDARKKAGIGDDTIGAIDRLGKDDANQAISIAQDLGSKEMGGTINLGLQDLKTIDQKKRSNVKKGAMKAAVENLDQWIRNNPGKNSIPHLDYQKLISEK